MGTHTQSDMYLALIRIAMRIATKCCELNALSSLEKAGIAQTLLCHARRNSVGIPYFDESSLEDHDDQDDMTNPTRMRLYMSYKEHSVCLEIVWRSDPIIPASLSATGETEITLDYEDDILHIVDPKICKKEGRNCFLDAVHTYQSFGAN